MRIYIYRKNYSCFIAVAKGSSLPLSWDGAKLFKTIDLLPGDRRFGLGKVLSILEVLQRDGVAPLGDYGPSCPSERSSL